MSVLFEKWMDNLSYDEISGAFQEFPFSQLAGSGGICGPFAGIFLLVMVDVPGFPASNWCIRFFTYNGLLSCGTGGASGTVSLVCDDKGRIDVPIDGQLKSLFDQTLRIVSTSTTIGGSTYTLYCQVGGLDPNSDFPGTAPPPNKTSKPTIDTTHTNDDEWGFTTISWTTPDDIADIVGFVVWRTASYPGATAQIRGTIAFSAVTHPNYSYPDYIGSDELPDPSITYIYHVQAYNFENGNTLSLISDPSDAIIFDAESPGPDPPPTEPDFEIPEEGELPGPPAANGTLTGPGFGGFNLGGTSLADAVFISDPSGIYTLVDGKTHDTLYERMTEIESQDVKIPDPFIRTAFI